MGREIAASERETAYKACKLHLQKPLKFTATNRQPGCCQNVQKIHRRNKESGCTNTYIYLSVRHSKKNCLFVKCAESSSAAIDDFLRIGRNPRFGDFTFPKQKDRGILQASSV
ncbi:hypothetical protein T4B_6449 [Trichinella pseudospiralis]|uniref:Uncharacterized protein n=1 Tax=Trichinella pseudospiralis TaxID=6337 RepID=A0A0V1EHG0_TRIPS|nr:hypothetical protein T4A_2769 [Trichinella pseudospiralis]KRY72977.1 hypothetical protein T4A_10135 [Trichinella pseudospiralis]KRZ00672.1 hypothetical protein T4B_6449 [Trichinella pseudospiralis]